jgi:SAM-dependent methyltransferase
MGELISMTNGVACSRPECAAAYLIVDGRPVLIDEERSLFTVADIIGHRQTTYRRESALRRLAKRILPDLTLNLRSRANYARLKSLLLANSPDPHVLVVGGRTVGRGMEPIATCRRIELIETDVMLGDRIHVVCDGHSLPFKSCSMDGVVVQAVLEHVVDPARCVSEIHRVLKRGGLVYAETPFMQQVHGGAYDFTRFTPLGHRRLFRHFEEISSGAVAGPGVALAWSYRYLLQGFARTRAGKERAAVIARLTGFWLKYFDLLLIDRQGAQDGSSCSYFFGRKSDRPLSDRELLRQYRGVG